MQTRFGISVPVFTVLHWILSTRGGFSPTTTIGPFSRGGGVCAVAAAESAEIAIAVMTRVAIIMGSMRPVSVNREVD